MVVRNADPRYLKGPLMTTSSTTSQPRTSELQASGLQSDEPRVRDVVSQLPGYVAGRRATGDLTAALASNESHYEPLPAVLDVVQRTAGRMNRYPDMAATELRERLADFLGVESNEVSVGPGSVGVLQQILTATCGPGDQVVFAWRSFEAYPILVSLTGATPVPVPLAPTLASTLMHCSIRPTISVTCLLSSTFCSRSAPPAAAALVIWGVNGLRRLPGPGPPAPADCGGSEPPLP